MVNAKDQPENADEVNGKDQPENASQAGRGMKENDKMMHRAVLDQRGDFVMLWTPKENNIIFEVQVSRCHCNAFYLFLKAIAPVKQTHTHAHVHAHIHIKLYTGISKSSVFQTELLKRGSISQMMCCAKNVHRFKVIR